MCTGWPGLNVAPARATPWKSWQQARLPASRAPGPPCEVTPPTWRRDVDGKADLVEEVARIAGFAALPSTPLPPLAIPPSAAMLTARQSRVRGARRVKLAADGLCRGGHLVVHRARKTAALFGGGDEALVLSNPIAAELDCMRPSILPNLIEAAGRNARRGFPDAALFEIGPVFSGDRPQDQRTAVAAILAPARPAQALGTRAPAERTSIRSEGRASGPAGGARRAG